MSKLIRFVTAFCMLASTFMVNLPVLRAENQGNPEDLFFMEIPSVITASKTEEPLLKAPGTVYVITDKDIEKYGYRNLYEILRSVANVDIINNYTWAQLGTRGFTNAYTGTLLLVDGYPMNNLQTDEARVNDSYPAQNIKRVEVLMGPNSTLYGSNAMTGVINVITKYGKYSDPESRGSEASYTLGQGNLKQITGNFHNNSKDISVGGAFSYTLNGNDFKQLKDFAVNTVDFSRNPTVDRTRSLNPGDVDLTQEFASADIYTRYKDFYMQYIMRDTLYLEGLGNIRGQYQGSGNLQDTRTTTVLGIKHAFNDNLSVNLEYQNVYQKIRNFWESAAGTSLANAVYTANFSYYNIYQNTYKALVNARITDIHTLVVGIDYFDNYDFPHGRTNGVPPPPSSYSAYITPYQRSSYYLQDKISLLDDKLLFTLGAHYNKQTGLDDTVTPRLSAIFAPSDTQSFGLLYGTGFRAPAAFEIVNVPSGYTIGPEKMEMYEANYKQKISSGKQEMFNELAAYRMKSTNAITSVLYSELANTPSGGWYTGNNKGEFVVVGAEDTLNWNVKKLSGFMGVGYVQPDQTTVAGQNIRADVAPFRVKLGASCEFLQRWNAGLRVDYTDAIQTDASTISGTGVEVFTVPSYYVASLNLSYKPVANDDSTIALHVDNLFNTTYYDAWNRGASPVQYMQPPLNVRLTLDVKFN